MKIREMIIKAMEELGYKDITIAEFSELYDRLEMHPMTFTDLNGYKREGRAYPTLDTGPGEEYSIYVEKVGDAVFTEDETWEFFPHTHNEPRVYMTLKL